MLRTSLIIPEVALYLNVCQDDTKVDLMFLVYKMYDYFTGEFEKQTQNPEIQYEPRVVKKVMYVLRVPNPVFFLL